MIWFIGQEALFMARKATLSSRPKRRRTENRNPVKRRVGWRDVSDEFWAIVAPLIPDDPVSPKGGRPPTPHRKIFNGILYVLRTGCQWKMMPREYGSGSVAHAHFQQWCRDGVFEKLWALCLKEYDVLKGIDWRWQSVDSATVSAPVKKGIPSARTRPIAARWAPNDMCIPMAEASRWA
jgi:transposase